MSASEKLNSADAVGAAIVRGGQPSFDDFAGPIKGHYRASLMRVRDAYRSQADSLAEQIVVARAFGSAEDEVDRLVKRLAELPREEVWSDEIFNVVTTVGKNDVLDKYLAGSAYTAAIVMGLKGAGTAVAADTMASHASWLEQGGANAPAYSGNRPTPAFGAASSGTKQTSSAVSFTFTSGGTVAGCFIVAGGSATKDNTTGVLLSAGDFSGGNKTVASTDVLNVTWSLAL